MKAVYWLLLNKRGLGGSNSATNELRRATGWLYSKEAVTRHGAITRTILKLAHRQGTCVFWCGNPLIFLYSVWTFFPLSPHKHEQDNMVHEVYYWVYLYFYVILIYQYSRTQGD